jgi:hypothetical protein
MLVREMERRECQELLTRLGFGRLACSRESQPYIDRPVGQGDHQPSRTHALYERADVGYKIGNEKIAEHCNTQGSPGAWRSGHRMCVV